MKKGTADTRWKETPTGETMGGVILMVVGAGGSLGGGFISLSGVGAAVGVPAAAVSAGLVTAGAGNVMSGLAGLGRALSTGSGAPNSSGGSPTSVEQVSPSDFVKTHRINRHSKHYARTKADVAENGMRETIKYVEADGKKYIVDGHHRIRIARELGLTTVPAERVQLPYKGYKTIDDLLIE